MGTPAFFVHPADAAHGDLGMIMPDDDVVVAISNSGESDELTLILPIIKRHGARLICITSRPVSTLGRASDISLDLGVTREADPLGLAPTSSTPASLALGDALAVALLPARGFSHDDFARSHPEWSAKAAPPASLRGRHAIGSSNAACDFARDGRRKLLETTRKGLGLCAVADTNTNPTEGLCSCVTRQDLTTYIRPTASEVAPLV